MIAKRIGDHYIQALRLNSKGSFRIEGIDKQRVFEQVAHLDQLMQTECFHLGVRVCADSERIEYLARALENDFRAGSPSGSLFADSIGIALAVRLLELEEKEPERTSRLSDLQLKRVLDFIEAQIQTPLSLDTLSKVAGVSNSHLRTWFKAATGQTVHRYVLRRRIEKARLLLLASDFSISEVAHLTGFAHQSHLAHWMRREIGETPRRLKCTRC
ncbi:AraC family transcriptional regulator [Rhizobium mesoamericanum]|uniref:Transcriptional regulator, AraC family n=1 Tax=Rhizobium mesoamericanum STM3625 TaxID=1211777 RepID=K0PG71_9HYPH